MTSTVGSMVGPISGLPNSPAAASLTDAGQGWDFAIGGLPFHLRVSEENPYERATAQFKKDQFDTTTEYGDQSLLGYWTRGQFSFHQGSGIDYYEAAEADIVRNRYKEAEGVDPFTPGEVSLFPSWQSATPDTHSSILDAFALDEKLVVQADGSVTYGELEAAGTEYAPTSAVVSTAVGGGNIYCALSDNTITRVGLALTYPKLYEYGFESGLDSWTSNTGFGNYVTATVGASAVVFDEGANSLEVTWPATSGSPDKAMAFRTITGLTAGRAYTLVMRVRTGVGTGAVVRPAVLFKASGSMVTTEGAFTTMSMTFVATGTQELIGIENTNLSGAGGEKTYVDKVVLYEGSRVGYDDGTTPTEAIYTHTTGLRSLHYAKDRLFMLDDTGTWHQLAPNPSGVLPVAVTSADQVFVSTGSGAWAVADTPGPVLFANGSRIFAVTQSETDGSFPTLSAPVQVADLPAGEAVNAISHYLGFLAIVTNLGVRIGMLLDNDRVAYGPRLVDWASAPSHTSVAREGECVYVTGDHGVIAINLAHQIGDGLEFSWTEAPNPFTGAETNYGVVAIGTTLVAWADGFLKMQAPTPADSGSLTTAFHRFGTLELKKFDSVRVRVGGEGGTVTVSKVLADGAVISLLTLDVTQTSGEDITLLADEPVEMMGLKFTLTPSGSASPILHGYQLRAMPAPRRQRLIRVPLSLYDVERRGTTAATGYTGSAWDRMQALEEMEETGGTFLFQDFRTGESGKCFIETIEHKGITPPGKQDRGYGGIVYLTIRKL